MQADRHKPQGHWTHWTSEGTFEIKSEFVAGLIVYRVVFQDRLIARYFEISSAIDDLLDGALDDVLGVYGVAAGLPDKLRRWNNLK